MPRHPERDYQRLQEHYINDVYNLVLLAVGKEVYLDVLLDERKRTGREWLHTTVQQLIEIAPHLELTPSERAFSFSPRALCPLCRRGSSDPHSRGFSLPEGLRRHLTGWGNMRQCVVTAALYRAKRMEQERR